MSSQLKAQKASEEGDSVVWFRLKVFPATTTAGLQLSGRGGEGTGLRGDCVVLL